MSALDNVFIRAYSRDSDAAGAGAAGAAGAGAAGAGAGAAAVGAAAKRIGRSAIVAESIGHSIIIGESAAEGNIFRFDSGWVEQTEFVLPILPDLADNSRAASDLAEPTTAVDESESGTRAPDSIPETDLDEKESALQIDINRANTAKVPLDEPRDATRPVRLDAAESERPSAHFRLMPRVPDVRAGQESNARTVTLEASAPRKRFIPVWEVETLIWSDASENLLANAEESLLGAGIYLRGACREGLRVLGVTSGSRGEGRTTIALCLARAVAASGIRVAILDADCENPDLANHVGLEAACGWDEVILGRLPLEEVAIHSLADRITVIPLTPAIANRPIDLDDQRVTAMVREAAELFDLVIIDMGPIGAAGRRMFESGTHCPLDATVIIRDLRSLPVEPTYTIGARLRAAGVKSVGIVENFAPRT